MPPRDPLQYPYVQLMMIAGLDVVLVVEGLQVAEHLIEVEDHEGEQSAQGLGVHSLREGLVTSEDGHEGTHEGLRGDQRF